MIFVILAHNSPQLLRKLLLRLKDKKNHFVVHVDVSCNIQPFLDATGGVENCHFTSLRFASSWGSFALVEATLYAFEYVRKVVRKRQRIVLLSGADYPIKPLNYITDYLDAHKDTIFIEYDSIPRKEWNNGGMDRFPFYEQVKNHITLYGGSQWFSIPPKALTIIFKFLELNPNFLEYFKYVMISDESFFQTLFLNCGNSYIEENLLNENLHYIEWDLASFRPKIFTIHDHAQLETSDKLFARKFDEKCSSTLFDKLDLK